MSNNPEVTVMMPTYNALSYVDSAILSLLSQTHKDLEILAYDDHSNDGTFERLEFWASQDKRIKIDRPFNEHGHYTEICNQMVEDARTEFIARMDADDISLPDRIETQLEFLKKRKTASLIGSMALNIIEKEGSRISYDYPWESQIIKPVASREIPVNEHIKSHHRLVHGTLFTRKSTMLEIGGYKDLFPIEDWELTLRLDREQKEIYILPDILYMRRIHELNASKNHPNKIPSFEYIKKEYSLAIADLPRSRPANL